MKTKLTVLSVISLMLVSIFMAGCGGEKYNKTIQLVRNGTLQMNPNVPIGKAFDQFFSNGKWESFTSTDNQTVVEFNGECTWYNAPAKIKVQFIVNGSNFNLEYVDINGVSMNLIERAGIIEKVLSEYKR